MKILNLCPLQPLGKRILALCKQAKVTPIVYGSLAYFVHTQDPEVEIRDFDLLVPEASFPILKELLDQEDDLTVKVQPYHSIEVYNDKLEVDLDSQEHFLFPRSAETITTELEGIELQILNRASLADIYREAIEQMPQIKKLAEKRQRYLQKLTRLEKKKTS